MVATSIADLLISWLAPKKWFQVQAQEVLPEGQNKNNHTRTYCEHWGTLEKPQLEYEYFNSIRKKVIN